MATFRELWSAIAPAGSLVASPAPARPERQVAWVRVLKARVPAFDAFDPGDVAVIPGAALLVVAPGQPEIGLLVDALVAGRASGLFLLATDGPDAALAALGEAVVAAGIPAIRVGAVDSQELERRAIGFLVNHGAELERQALLIETSLAERALAGADVATLVAAVGGVIGRAIALEGGRGETIAIHAPEMAEGAAAAAAAYLAGGRRAALRVPLPAAPAPPSQEAGSGGAGTSARRPVRPGSLEGRLLLLGDRPATDLERAVGPRIARLLALEMVRTDAVRRAQDRSRRAEVLPADGPPSIILVARQLRSGAVPSLEAREEVRARVRLLAPPRRLALRGDAESLELRLVLAADARDPGGAGLADRIADLLERPIAVSRPFAEPAGRPIAEAEARSTLEAVEELPDGPRLARSDRLPAYRLLLAMHSLPDGHRRARPLLEPVLVGSADARRERLATLGAVLDTSGMAEAAASLGIHRNTLGYRIRRIEALTGWRLADPRLRLPLSIAVRLVQSEQD